MMKWVIIILFTIMVLFISFNRIGESDKYLKSIQLTGIPAKKESFQKAKDVNTAVRMEKLLKLIELSNVPVKLYGVVIDENERPVSGAVVSWRVGQGGYFNSPTPVRRKSITDSRGLFTIDGVRGTSLGFDEITKSGYHQSRKGYSVKHQNPNNPKVNPIKFLILKNDVPEATNLEDISVPLNWNGGPNHIPIGIANSELIVVAIRDPRFDRNSRFEWNITISISNASLIEIGQSHSDLAPIAGYTTYLNYSTAKNQDFSEEKTFVFRTSNNIYGKIALNLSIGDPAVQKCLDLKISVNQSGSRNLSNPY